MNNVSLEFGQNRKGLLIIAVRAESILAILKGSSSLKKRKEIPVADTHNTILVEPNW